MRINVVDILLLSLTFATHTLSSDIAIGKTGLHNRVRWLIFCLRLC